MVTPEYRQFIEDLKARVTSARLSAARAVNRDLILLYWDIGRAIVEKQKELGWGESVIDRVSRDLREAFPGTTGFSPRNLRSVKQFYLAHSDPAIWLQVVAKLRGSAELGDAEIWRQAVARSRDGGKRLHLAAKLTEETITESLRHLVAEMGAENLQRRATGNSGTACPRNQPGAERRRQRRANSRP